MVQQFKSVVPISHWALLYQVLSEVSMNKIVMLINVCAHDLTVECAIIDINQNYIV